MKLSRLKSGEKAVVKEIMLNNSLKTRLGDMGMIKGIEIVLIRTAPFGDPIEVQVGNTFIALRINDAENVIVEKIYE